jgi:hypothetical protein
LALQLQQQQMAIKSQMLEEAKKTETTESFMLCAGFPIHLRQCKPCQRTTVLSNFDCLTEVHGMLVLSFDRFWSSLVLRFAVTPLAPYFLLSNNDKQQPDPLVTFCKIIVCLPLLGGAFPLSMGPTRATLVKRRSHLITAFYCFTFRNLGKAISGL